jgi:hypothetical protein
VHIGQGDSILSGTDADVQVDVENVGGSATAVELALEFVAPDGSTVGGFDTVTTSELAVGASETVTFTDVTGGLPRLGFYDVVVSATDTGDQVSSADELTVSVDVNGNSEAAADAPDGPASFDGLFDDVTGSGEFGIADVVELFENFNDPVVQNNPRFFRFDRPDEPNPESVGIADVVALFNAL